MRLGALTAVTVNSRPHYLLRCYAVPSGRSLATLSRTHYLHLQGEKVSQEKQQAEFSLPFHSEDYGSTFLRNVCKQLPSLKDTTLLNEKLYVLTAVTRTCHQLPAGYLFASYLDPED
jgi:hypothetical protein